MINLDESKCDKKNKTIIDKKQCNSYSIIKKIFSSKNIKLLIDSENISTEAFFNHTAQQNLINDESSDNSNDTRNVLNKQTINIWKFLKLINARLQYISSGSTGHFFKGTILNENKMVICNFAMKVSAYQKRKEYGSIYNLTRPENTELVMIRALSYFVVTKQTPHLILPIKTFYSDIEPFLKLIKGNLINDNKGRYKDFIDRYEKGKYENTVSVLFSELASHGDFLDFIKNNFKVFNLTTWKVFFFQILSVLAIIQSKYPSFRHNDMKANNILVTQVQHNALRAEYTICNKKYIIPNIGFIIKLWDFDFACISDVIGNKKVEEEWTKKINITSNQNRYYDIHYFFNTLIHRGFFPEILTNRTYIDKEVEEFIKRVIPTTYRVSPTANDKGRLMIDVEYTTPKNILESDSFFNDFREKNN
jgi:hypothetical protein